MAYKKLISKNHLLNLKCKTMKRLIFISIFLAIGLLANAQCDNNLVEKAKSKMTNNERFLKELKIELKEASIDDPAPVARFSINLVKETKYRLRIENDSIKHKSTGIIKLYDDDRLLGISYVDQTDTYYPFLILTAHHLVFTMSL